MRPGQLSKQRPTMPNVRDATTWLCMCGNRACYVPLVPAERHKNTKALIDLGTLCVNVQVRIHGAEPKQARLLVHRQLHLAASHASMIIHHWCCTTFLPLHVDEHLLACLPAAGSAAFIHKSFLPVTPSLEGRRPILVVTCKACCMYLGDVQQGDCLAMPKDCSGWSRILFT